MDPDIIWYVPNLAPWQRPANWLPCAIGLQIQSAKGKVFHEAPKKHLKFASAARVVQRIVDDSQMSLVHHFIK
jgi:hypothetical protein